MAGVKRSVGLTFSVAVALLIGAPPAISAAAPSLPSSSADAMDVPPRHRPGSGDPFRRYGICACSSSIRTCRIERFRL